MSILISLVFDNQWEINSVQTEYKYVVFQKKDIPWQHIV